MNFEFEQGEKFALVVKLRVWSTHCHTKSRSRLECCELSTCAAAAAPCPRRGSIGEVCTDRDPLLNVFDCVHPPTHLSLRVITRGVSLFVLELIFFSRLCWIDKRTATQRVQCRPVGTSVSASTMRISTVAAACLCCDLSHSKSPMRELSIGKRLHDGCGLREEKYSRCVDCRLRFTCHDSSSVSAQMQGIMSATAHRPCGHEVEGT